MKIYFLFFVYFFNFIFFNFTILYWFCHISTRIHHRYTRVSHPSGSSQCTSPKHSVLCIEPGLVTHFIYDIICFNAILPNHPTLSLSHRIQKTVLYISVSFAVSYYILIFILLLLLLLSRFSRVRLCDPIDGSPPGSLSLGFSRQEHWSELPFTSPMHQSEKWKRSCSVVSDSDIFYFLITYFKIKVSYFLLPINQ